MLISVVVGLATVKSWLLVVLFGVGSGCRYSVLVGAGSVVIGVTTVLSWALAVSSLVFALM